jgi:hypothetical protein
VGGEKPLFFALEGVGSRQSPREVFLLCEEGFGSFLLVSVFVCLFVCLFVVVSGNTSPHCLCVRAEQKRCSGLEFALEVQACLRVEEPYCFLGAREVLGLRRFPQARKLVLASVRSCVEGDLHGL